MPVSRDSQDEMSMQQISRAMVRLLPSPGEKRVWKTARKRRQGDLIIIQYRRPNDVMRIAQRREMWKLLLQQATGIPMRIDWEASKES